MTTSTKIVALAACLLAMPPAGASAAAPSKKELAKQQLDYAKQLFGEGNEAMANEDYKTALEKFRMAYQYAPDKHLFNYNIGMAALLAGDCNSAKASFQYFLSTVKKHPERKTAEAKLAEIESRGCVTEREVNTDDEEDEAFDSAPGGSRQDREKAQEEERRHRMLHKALREVRESEALYAEVAKRDGKTAPFASVARYKKRQEKKLVKLLGKHEIAGPERKAVLTGGSLPRELKKACAKAAKREKAASKQYERVAGEFEEADIFRTFTRLSKTASGRHLNAFENCAYGKK